MIEMNWDDLRLFLAVAEHGGLAGAARVTGSSAPTLGRRMLGLERHLNAELFLRQPRGYVLTEEGAALRDRLQPVAQSLAPLGQPQSPKARIKISAGAWMTYALSQRAGALLQGIEDTTLQFIAADHVLDIAHREAVIGIRNHRPEARGLAGRRIGEVKFAVYAAGPKISRWVKVMGQTPSARWVAENTHAADIIEVTDPRTALDLAKAGVAKVVLPTFVGEGEAQLVPVSDPIAELTHDQWIVSHHDERFAPKVRPLINRLYKIVSGIHLS